MGEDAQEGARPLSAGDGGWKNPGETGITFCIKSDTNAVGPGTAKGFVLSCPPPFGTSQTAEAPEPAERHAAPEETAERPAAAGAFPTPRTATRKMLQPQQAANICLHFPKQIERNMEMQ